MDKRICSVEECAAKVNGKGMCMKHYGRFHRTGSTSLLPKPVTICAVGGCEDTGGVRSGYCPNHWRTHGAPEHPCKGCGRPIRAYQRVYCSSACAPTKRSWSFVCQQCGLAFIRHKAQPRQFCSAGCAAAAKRTALRHALDTDASPEVILEAIRAQSIENDDGCWIWQHGFVNGYGVFYSSRRTGFVHRLALELTLGVALGKEQAHHICAVKVCVNPAHLQRTTALQNMGEMMLRRYYIGRIADLETALREVAPTHSLLDCQEVP